MPQITVIQDAPSVLEAVDLRRHSLTEQVYDAIRDAIVSKALPPGIRLSEAALAEKFGVSKTPVREALLRLGAVGLVESAANATRVVTPSRDRIRHAYEVRGGHEFTAARLASARAGRRQVAELQRVAAESVMSAEAGDALGFRELDARFHRGVARAASNPLLLQLVENSFSLTWALRRRDVPVTGDSIDCARQHVSIAGAIREHEAERASIEMLAHIDKVMNMVLDALKDEVQAAV
ncbi:MAG TPA: GntR family transcriptional regulator [Candidatus Dormibacteraeota bacterium]